MSIPSNSSRLSSKSRLVAPLVVLLAACSSHGDAGSSTPRPSATDATHASGATTASISGGATSGGATSGGATSGAPSSVTAAGPRSTRITTGNYDGVVLSVAAPRDTGLRTVDKATIDGTWTPTADDIASFEAGLGPYLAAHTPAWAKELPHQFHSYKRQWIGVTAGGKRKIWGNFFCREMDGWKENIIGVDDGGDCYFQIFFDVESKQFVDLMINGMG